jgi:hypothetical protein
MTKTERIAFDWKRLQIRQVVIDTYGRTRVPSCAAKHLKRFTVDTVQRSWEKRGYVRQSYNTETGVQVMEYKAAEEKAA